MVGPVVAIVGRPNVGKSTLFNRLARAKRAIVHDEPGVTRDRQYASTNSYGRAYTLVDTGGYDPEGRDPMQEGIVRQVQAAIDEADVIVFVLDARSGPTPADFAAAKLLRQSRKPVVYAANKADSASADAEASDLYRLGMDVLLPVSALHGRGMGELETAVARALPATAEAPTSEEPPRIALVGRPNAGKSSLLNAIVGQDRVLVDERPGTTRDAVDVEVERAGKRYVFVDTAGIRRKSKVAKGESAVEGLSVGAAIRSVARADLVVVVCSAAEGIAEQDAKIVGLAEERGRALIVALSKADLLSGRQLATAERDAAEQLTFVGYAPIVRTSAKTGLGLDELFATMDRVRGAFERRVSTGELNRFFEEVLERRPPPTSGGKAPRIYYITQTQVAPPTFVAMTNAPDAIHFSYQRFLTNQLRERFGFEGSPIRVRYRARRRGVRRHPA